MMIDSPYIFMLGLGLGWLTLALGLILFRTVSQWWRARRFGDPINHGLLLVEYGKEFTGVKHHTSLEDLLVEKIPSEFNIKRASLLLPDEYQLVPACDGSYQLPINHAAVRWVASSGEAQLANKGHLLELVQQTRTDLTWAEIWIPLMRGSRLRGLWLLGPRVTGFQFSPDDLRCLTSIAREAAAVIEALAFAEQERLTAQEMRALYRQVIAAREDERGRLTRELHDGVLQDLCAVVRDLKAYNSTAAVQDPAGKPQETSYDDIVVRSGETVSALRAVCNDLRPPLLGQDLITALKALIQDLDSRSGAPVHIEFQGNDLRLGDEAELAVFRITQEALNNAISHSDASEIAVRLTQYPDRLRLTVTDDGCGIKGSTDSAHFVSRGHYGLAGMRERAAMVGGKLEVQTAVDYGTAVVLDLPLAESQPEKQNPGSGD